jgi:hypothetical protein
MGARLLLSSFAPQAPILRRKGAAVEVPGPHRRSEPSLVAGRPRVAKSSAANSVPKGTPERWSAMKNDWTVNSLMQIGLVGFTALGFLLTSLKLPQYGVIANLMGQVFWLYSSYKAWRQADQIGIFIATISITFILFGGLLNYWLLR